MSTNLALSSFLDTFLLNKVCSSQGCTKFQHHITLKIMEKWKQNSKIHEKDHLHRDLLSMISTIVHCCNAGTLLPLEMGYPQHRSFVEILCRALYHNTIDPLLKNGSSKWKLQNSKQTVPVCPMKITIINMHILYRTSKDRSNVANDNTRAKLLDILYLT